jgi:MFS-type transporter involved in bile tolerance (Atg22 family)
LKSKSNYATSRKEVKKLNAWAFYDWSKSGLSISNFIGSISIFYGLYLRKEKRNTSMFFGTALKFGFN